MIVPSRPLADLGSNLPTLSSVTHKTLFTGLELEAGVVCEKNTVGWLVAGSWCWNGVREKYC